MVSAVEGVGHVGMVTRGPLESIEYGVLSMGMAPGGGMQYGAQGGQQGETGSLVEQYVRSINPGFRSPFEWPNVTGRGVRLARPKVGSIVLGWPRSNSARCKLCRDAVPTLPIMGISGKRLGRWDRSIHSGFRSPLECLRRVDERRGSDSFVA